MILTRYERMIARRYLLPGKGEGFIFVVAAVSLLAVTLGVAALIIVMSVMNGFRAELFDKIIGLNGHAVVQSYSGRLSDWQSILAEAKRTLDHWYQLAGDAAPGFLCADLVEALSDDLNTPKALAALHELRSETAKGSTGAAASLKASARLMGLLQHSAAEWAAWRPSSLAIDEARIADLIGARNAARKAKDFKQADQIRNELAAMSIELEDKKDGTTTWRVKR